MSATPLDGGALRRRLADGDTTLGTFVGMASAIAAEVCAAAGADWILIDLEHGAGTEDAVRDGVLAAGAYGVPTVVRVETGDRLRIGRVLDQGAAGVMIPRLDNPDQVADVLIHLRYPPHGDRGVATYNRSCRWGMDRSGLTDTSRRPLGVIQIETLSALAAVDDIAALDGVDVLFVGPLDLSFALGVPLQFGSAPFIDALDRVLAAAITHGKTAGILAASANLASDYIGRGFRFVTIGSDSSMLAGAVQDAFTTARSTCHSKRQNNQ